jgi:Predicted pyridoxal phosphate-dependent enzyme apparently involved in regulation of cell wall biogenesis
MNNKRIYLSPPHMSGEELDFIHEAFSSNWIAPVGPHVDAFEKEFCQKIGARHAAAVSSGTAALHLAAILAGVQNGDEVACSTFTFAGSVFPVIYRGATPVFIDCEERSWNMDPQLFEDAIKNRTKKGKKIKAAIVVHLYGQSADLDPIMDICGRYDITLIEDAAESLGATYKGKCTGTMAPIGIFSFNGNKIVTTSGGGMLVSSDREIVEKARFLATQARDPAPHYEHSCIGYNYRLSNVLAGIGRAQLHVLQERIDKKRDIFSRYFLNLSRIPGFAFMPEAEYGISNRWLTCLTIDPDRSECSAQEIRRDLEAENIESRPLWKPMHLQQVFSGAPSYINGVSERLFRNGLCLPSGTNMDENDMSAVVDCIMKASHANA